MDLSGVGFHAWMSVCGCVPSNTGRSEGHCMEASMRNRNIGNCESSKKDVVVIYCVIAAPFNASSTCMYNAMYKLVRP